MGDTMKSVLITGCSTGIGRALALEFNRKGLLVYATARNPESLQDLAGMGMVALKLDVNDETDIKKAADFVREKSNGIDILVNNAGFIAMGPMVEIPLDRLRQQFETNVISVISMSQAFVPDMIKNRRGMVVNIGSVSGILTSPFAGAYCASKSAVHSLSDALRMELSPFGIAVITVQPGGISSELGNTAHKGIISGNGGASFYEKIASAIEQRALASQVNATPAGEFAEMLVKELLSENPRPVVRLGRQSSLIPFIRYAFPQRLRDGILKKKFGLLSLKKSLIG
jgi:short-subunit dehydrogenase